jgi:long-subunit fatty acid transport protein
MKLLLVTGLFALSLHAQDFYRTTSSARSSALGGIYTPSDDAVTDALAANPAGLTALKARALNLGLAGIFARGSFSNAVNTNSPLRDSPGAVPSAAFGSPLGHSRFTLGLGLVPELLSVSNWNYVDAPGAAGASYGLQTQKSAIIALRAVAGVGFALNDRISLGFSAGAVYNSNTLDAPYIFQSNPVLAGLKTLLNLHTTGVGWNVGAGLTARLIRNLHVNAAWKSRTVIDSTGKASGNLSQQFAALGLTAAPGFSYSATVHNVLPDSLLAGFDWRATGRWRFLIEANRIGWRSAFRSLPVSLSGGTNATVNSLLASTSLNDGVALLWKDQYVVRAGVERPLSESILLRAGFAHANNPVPASTLSPLTAAIMTDRLSTGLGYRSGRWRFDLAYSFNPLAHEAVRHSALLSGEYSNSAVSIGTQSLTLDTSLRF